MKQYNTPQKKLHEAADLTRAAEIDKIETLLRLVIDAAVKLSALRDALEEPDQAINLYSRAQEPPKSAEKPVMFYMER